MTTYDMDRADALRRVERLRACRDARGRAAGQALADVLAAADPDDAGLEATLLDAHWGWIIGAW